MRLFRRTAGLWTVRRLVRELTGLREEVAGLRQELRVLVALQADALQGQRLRETAVTSRGQGFVTAPAPAAAAESRLVKQAWWAEPGLVNPRPILPAEEDAGGVAWTDNRTLADYLEVESDLTSVLGHVPSPEQVEQEYRLRRQQA